MTPRLRAESTTVTTVNTQQQWHIFDNDLLQLLAGAQPHDLHFGRIQTQSASLHPAVDIGNAHSEADNGSGGIVGWHTDIYLGDQIALKPQFWRRE